MHCDCHDCGVEDASVGSQLSERLARACPSIQTAGMAADNAVACVVDVLAHSRVEGRVVDHDGTVVAAVGADGRQYSA